MVVQLGTHSVQTEDDGIDLTPSELEDSDAWVPVYEILSYPADYTLEVLHEKWKREEIIVPKFQRSWVWNITQASRLVESFLMGLPVPNIFLFKDPTRSMIVIDGLQRLRAVVGFIEGTLPGEDVFKLQGVNERWVGLTYQSLHENDRKTFRDSVLRAIIVNQVHPDDHFTSMFHIFERLNTGGSKLLPQEVRNCVYQGAFNDALVTMNQDADEWRMIFGSPRVDKHMRDVELILRFLALHDEAVGKTAPYAKPMKLFLNNYAEARKDETEIGPYTDLFRQTTRQVAESLGEKPFHGRQSLNASVFDAVMVAFSQANSIPKDIKGRYKILVENTEFSRVTTAYTTDVNNVKTRRELAQKILFG